MDGYTYFTNAHVFVFLGVVKLKSAQTFVAIALADGFWSQEV